MAPGIPLRCFFFASLLFSFHPHYTTSNSPTIKRPWMTNVNELSPSHLARAALDPPASLCKKLFPAIDEWHDQLAAKKKLSPDSNNPIQSIVIDNTFLQVIMMLRKTFIQDLVLMMDLHPCHPIWQHSIFSDPAYFSLKRDLQQCAPIYSIF
ncbi:hypothetical protein [Absidia glauca]|uniref:Ndc10 domain-containing protein n=1 Tax=Absidia glauca TaxID=4829 RepID=A0A163JK62_ABSGL|nr:hypothetical protein [Absidia glauca]